MSGRNGVFEHGKPSARFRQVRDAIQQRIRDWLEEKTAST